ncbi:MAG TPA: dihydropteroate synthase [Phycisphaerae bacterium]|nr:dihydropteroate synthase [Phycisphaerae bacterium]
MIDMKNFAAIGENIHCSRIFKRGGVSSVELPGGGEGIKYVSASGEPRVLAIPGNWGDLSPAYNDGKIKHIAVALHQATQGKGDDQKAGEDYLAAAAARQVNAGAAFLDVNVDEYTNDAALRVKAMRWLVSFVSKRAEIPISVDSSSVEALAAGLESCRDLGRPHMVNSVSLDRTGAVEVIRRFKSEAIVSAAGAEGMPSAVEERMANFEKIIALLDQAGVPRAHMHLDPLVFPISTDPMHGKNFLETTRQAKQKFKGVRLSGGFSNVSFGMPQRKLLNMVFTYLAVEAGASSGIIDPVTMSPQDIAAMDESSEGFRLAKAFLTGEDMYGMEFIAAHREGRLG